MDHLDDLEMRVNELISELSGIIQRLRIDIGDAKKAIPFDQVKVIENSIARMQKQGIPVPEELKALKIKLLSEHERHKARIALHRKIQESIGGLLNRETPPGPRRIGIPHPQDSSSPYRKPPSYERALGSRGHSNLDNYLIPVIKLIWNGLDHKEAFRKIAQKLDVRYNTVSSQCTRALGLTTDEFIHQVNSKSIVNLIEKKYPDKYQRIEIELET